MTLPFILLALVISTLLYHLVRFITAYILNLRAPHYFLGFNSGLFNIHWRQIKFSMGLYIPLPGLTRTYVVKQDKKIALNYVFDFPTSSVWKRFLISLSGLMMLFIMTILSFFILVYSSKDSYVSKNEVNK